jgi:hypothetical protein
MKFWVCINNEIYGPLEPAEAAKVKGFTLFAWACMDTPHGAKGEDQRAWKRAISFPELAANFFPNYPPPQAGRPVSCEAPPPVPPAEPPAGIALEPAPEVMAEINRKLDDLLSRRTPGGTPRSDEALVREFMKTEQMVEKLASGSGREALHLELEPLNRRLDAAERNFAGMKDGLGKETLRLEMAPLSQALAVTERAVEEIKREIESRDIRHELEPLSSKLEMAERAIEAEDARIALFREEVVARIAALEAAIKDFRAELAAAHPAAAADAGRAPSARASGPGLKPVLQGAAMAAFMLAVFALYPEKAGREFLNPPIPPLPVRQAPFAPSAAAAPEPAEVAFARAYRVSAGSPDLAGAIAADAASRGGAAGQAEWRVEPVRPSYCRLLVTVPRAGGGRLEYYYGVYRGRGRIRPLNRAAARTLVPAGAAESRP